MNNEESFFTNKEILLLGGTGSLGKTLTALLLLEHKPRGIRIYSRGELEQWKMATEFRLRYGDKIPVAFLIGDVRDLPRLNMAMTNVDVCIHAAALKHVPICENNPCEAVNTNINGALNVLSAAIYRKVPYVMNVSTDKAVKPVNIYGASKMTAEKVFIHGNVYTGGHVTKLSCCRYGNVLASRGSIAHIFRDQYNRQVPLTITSKHMTRFWITLPQVGRFLLKRITHMQGGEVFVPKMKSMGILDMAYAMTNPDYPYTETGIRQGEKLHEILFHTEEYAYDRGDYYEIFPSMHGEGSMLGELVSNKNPNGDLTKTELLAMLEESL